MAQTSEPAARSSTASKKLLRIHGVIARDLGMKIVSGHYRPGDILEGEVASSEQLQVSRSAYREAIKILTAKGLVESRPKVGTRVSPQSQWHLLDPDLLSWVFEGNPDESILRSLFELRRIVEPPAAALAAARRTPEQLRGMREALDDMAHHTISQEEGRLADERFHALLLSATCNPFIISLTEGVTSAVNNTTAFKQRDMPLHRDPMPDHEAVYQAIADQDTQGAETAMAELIRLALLDTPLGQVTGQELPDQISEEERRAKRNPS